MTDLSSLFSFYNLCSGRGKVRIADGSLSPVLGKCSIVVTPPMLLSSHVPDFAANLLSIACIHLLLSSIVSFTTRSRER
jgi:hypothetical protein